MLIWLTLACGAEKKEAVRTEIEQEEQENTEQDISEGYNFQNKEGLSSVSYGGQICRQVLIHDLKEYISDLDERVLIDVIVPNEVQNDLHFYFESVSEIGDFVPHQVVTDPAVEQETYGDISTGKNLVDKLAGNDSVTDYKDWNSAFIGWEADGISSPESLIEHWFAQLDNQASSWGNPSDHVLGERLEHVYITPEGQDLQQLIEKFLRAGISFAQASDDYLDDDIEGKGLLSTNIPEAGKSYSPLEHSWDEAFGYFGAARSYASWTDQDIAELEFKDIDKSGTIDLLSEVNWGHSLNAAKRDRDMEGVDFTTEAWQGFYQGRKLLSETSGTELTEEQLEELKGYRDQVLSAWEKTIGATAIHYINVLHQDLERFGTEEFDFETTAKHWSELKGFALSFQFNPRSSVLEEDFQALHHLIGQQVDFEDVEDYRANLEHAKQILGDSFGFNPSFLGDENGQDGW